MRFPSNFFSFVCYVTSVCVCVCVPHLTCLFSDFAGLCVSRPDLVFRSFFTNRESIETSKSSFPTGGNEGMG